MIFVRELYCQTFRIFIEISEKELLFEFHAFLTEIDDSMDHVF